jgi:PleD family two-component response regulator
MACQVPWRGSNARLIAMADEALHAAKKSGSNQVYTFAGKLLAALSDFAAS